MRQITFSYHELEILNSILTDYLMKHPESTFIYHDLQRSIAIISKKPIKKESSND